jgi:glutamate--cysteine ligase
MSNKSSDARLQTRIDASLRPLLIHGLKGIEKESLRITREGAISQLPHPRRLGAALTHPHITTDYSEALLELITPALPDGNEMLGFLTHLHQYVCANLGDELLLAGSMPIGDLRDPAIPIAEYGSSNVGRMKHIYRQGLSYRYGRCMQVIAGIHFNYSLPEPFWPQYQHSMKHAGDLRSFTTQAYMRMIRNLQRYGWLILYLSGSSPAVGKSFVDSRNSLYSGTLQQFDETSYYKPFATSLRMSEIGYLNPVQSMFHVSFNSLDEYIRDLGRATTIPYLGYERIGAKVGDQYRQLNTHFLQIENEYYTSVRPKQPAQSGERPLQALGSRGIQYVEIRSVDVDMFEPAGIAIETTRFLEALGLFCLFQPNAGHDLKQHDEISHNALSVANRGREPGLKLLNDGREIPLQQWALRLCEQMREICEILDNGNADKPYTRALHRQIEAIRHPELTASARVLAAMRAQKMSITELVLQKSLEYTRYFQDAALDAAVGRSFDLHVAASLAQQDQLDATDEIPLNEYLDNYFSQDPSPSIIHSQDTPHTMARAQS